MFLKSAPVRICISIGFFGLGRWESDLWLLKISLEFLVYIFLYFFIYIFYSPFCVQAKIIKLVGLKNGGRLSPINLVTFAGTQNGELPFCINQPIFR
jgi:hypothetical protein